MRLRKKSRRYSPISSAQSSPTTRGTAGRIFSALAHAHINVKMIDQGSSELNIIVGVKHEDFKDAIRALYEIFVLTQI